MPRRPLTAVLLALLVLVGPAVAPPDLPLADAIPSAAAVADLPMSELSPELGDYLARRGPGVGVRVVDLVSGASWASNGQVPYVMASSIKLLLLVTYLDRLELTRKSLTRGDRTRLRAMITRSDNSAASYYYRRIGGSAGIERFLIRARIGTNGYGRHPGSWGWSTITPRLMSAILARLARGRILTKTHRTYALSLLRRVVRSQRFGVGATAPRRAVVALKNGWVRGPTGCWAVNSSGIVRVGKRRWVVSIYTCAASYATGVRVTNAIASQVAAAMMKRPTTPQPAASSP